MFNKPNGHSLVGVQTDISVPVDYLSDAEGRTELQTMSLKYASLCQKYFDLEVPNDFLVYSGRNSESLLSSRSIPNPLARSNKFLLQPAHYSKPTALPLLCIQTSSQCYMFLQ